MASKTARRRYKVGTVLMRTDGVTHVKLSDGWHAEHRLIMQNMLGRDLEEGEKVFHRDNTLRGEKGYAEGKNLVLIKCRTTKWIKLSQSRVMYEPKKEPLKLREYAI